MKSTWIRLLALAMAVLLLVPMLAGCGGDGDEDKGSKAQKLENETVIDCEGYVFDVYDYFKTRWEPEVDGSKVNDRILSIMDEVEELYNCDIVFHELNVNEVFTQVQPAVASGDKYGDLIIATMWAYGPLLGAGLLGDLNQLEGMNRENPWWNQKVMDTVTIKGKTLAGGATFTDHSYLTWSCYFNKDMFRNLGHDPEELYTLVRNGEWTYSKFVEYAKTALIDQDGSGMVDSADDIWGLVAPGGDYNRAAFLAMGGKFYMNDEEGNLVLGCKNQHAYDVVEFMRNMFKNEKIWMNSDGEAFADIMSHFTGGNSLFIMCSPGEEAIRNMDADFGFLPQPKWDAAQEEYIGMVDHNAPLFAITNTQTERYSKIGYIMEAIAMRYEDVNELTLDNWDDTVWRSDEDREMMREYVYKHGGYDLAPIAQNADSSLGAPMGYVLNSTMGTNTDFASTLAAAEKVLAARIEAWVSGGIG